MEAAALEKLATYSDKQLQDVIFRANKQRKILKEMAKAAEETRMETETTNTEKRKQEEEPDFIAPKKTSKATVTQPNQVKLSNKFNILAQNTPGTSDNTENQDPPKDEDYEEEEDTNETENEQNNKTPIVLRSKEEWTILSKLLKIDKINYTKATVTKEGIRIQPQTINDFRKMYRCMKTNKFQFHTHQHKSEKPLKIVIKGIPVETELDDIMEDLKDQDYPASKITRMNAKGGRPAQMVLIELERKYRSFYDIERVNGLCVKVEPLRSKGIPQCHRCQLFGHVQANCNAEYRCMKCAENHSTHLCTKERTTPARCSNCNGEHTSIYKLCPARPKITERQTPPEQTIPNRRTAWKTNPQPESQPKNEESTENPTEKTNTKKAVASELTEMLIQFSEKENTEEELNKFNKHIHNILKLL